MKLVIPEAQRPLFSRLAAVTVEVRKLTEDGYGAGSGVVLTADGLILTAHHVITRSRVVRVRRLHLDKKRWHLWTYGTYTADVVWRDRRADVSVLKLRKPPPDLAFAEIGSPDTLEIGDALYRVGRDVVPLAAGYVLDLGKHDRLPEIDVGMHAQPGSSGGPIFDKEGRLVAICLRYQSDDKMPPKAHGIPLSSVKTRIFRRKEIRDLLSPEDHERLLGLPPERHDAQ